MKASGKIGSNGVQVSDNVEKRFETDIYIHIHKETVMWTTRFDRSCVFKPTFLYCGKLRLKYYYVNKANLLHNFSQYVYFFSVHVSGDYVPIVRRNNCIYATFCTCYSVQMTVWYAGWNENLHTSESSMQNNKYQVSHKYCCFY